jgi:polar amino acid transport system substrate-binding protein
MAIYENIQNVSRIVYLKICVEDSKSLLWARMRPCRRNFNRINQLVATKMLSKYGLIVDIANNGEEALQQIFSNQYDLVFMDIQMPVLDGLSAVRKLRKEERFKNLPIVAMSAGVTLDEQSACNEAGMTAFIAKPIDSALLIRHY